MAEYQQQDARIRYTLLPQSLGISGNTNAALALATGDYIALFDHDDLLPPEGLFEVVQALQQQFAQVRVVTWSGPFHYAAINNEAVRQARGEYILLLNNDVFLSKPTSLVDMMGYIRVPGVGVVGAKLLYPNNTIQHAGVVIGLGGAGHVFVQHPDGVYGYMAVNYSAVTGACLLVAKKVYQAVDGMDERFAVSFNDVDFCLKVIEAGYRVVYDAYARWYHHESLTRGLDTSVAKRERLESEHQLLRQKWPQYFVHGDPMYNPNWSLRAAFRLDEPKMGV